MKIKIIHILLLLLLVFIVSCVFQFISTLCNKNQINDIEQFYIDAGLAGTLGKAAVTGGKAGVQAGKRVIQSAAHHGRRLGTQLGTMARSAGTQALEHGRNLKNKALQQGRNLRSAGQAAYSAGLHSVTKDGGLRDQALKAGKAFADNEHVKQFGTNLAEGAMGAGVQTLAQTDTFNQLAKSNPNLAQFMATANSSGTIGSLLETSQGRTGTCNIGGESHDTVTQQECDDNNGQFISDSSQKSFKDMATNIGTAGLAQAFTPEGQEQLMEGIQGSAEQLATGINESAQNATLAYQDTRIQQDFDNMKLSPNYDANLDNTLAQVNTMSNNELRENIYNMSNSDGSNLTNEHVNELNQFNNDQLKSLYYATLHSQVNETGTCNYMISTPQGPMQQTSENVEKQRCDNMGGQFDAHTTKTMLNRRTRSGYTAPGILNAATGRLQGAAEQLNRGIGSAQVFNYQQDPNQQRLLNRAQGFSADGFMNQMGEQGDQWMQQRTDRIERGVQQGIQQGEQWMQQGMQQGADRIEQGMQQGEQWMQRGADNATQWIEGVGQRGLGQNPTQPMAPLPQQYRQYQQQYNQPQYNHLGIEQYNQSPKQQSMVPQPQNRDAQQSRQISENENDIYELQQGLDQVKSVLTI